MTKTKLFRTLALINFTVLISIFLLYRHGLFHEHNYIGDENSFTSPNGGTSTTIIKKDSLSQKSRAWGRTMLSSSKSVIGIIPVDRIYIEKNDTSNLAEQLKRIINRFASPENTKTEKVSSDTLSSPSKKPKKK